MEINIDLKAMNKTNKVLKFIIKSNYKLLIFYLRCLLQYLVNVYIFLLSDG